MRTHSFVFSIVLYRLRRYIILPSVSVWVSVLCLFCVVPPWVKSMFLLMSTAYDQPTMPTIALCVFCVSEPKIRRIKNDEDQKSEAVGSV